MSVEKRNPIISGNTPIDEAEVVLLGEHHVDRSQRMVKDVVKQHAQKGDVFLFESVEAVAEEISRRGKTLYRRIYGFPRRAKVEGWDLSTSYRREWLRAALTGDTETALAYQQARERSLVRSIADAKNRYPERRVFVSSGLDHVRAVALEVQKRYKTAIVDASVPYDAVRSAAYNRALAENYGL